MIILLAFSCGQNSSEEELNGNWREIENEYSTWCFYPDSIVFKIDGNTEEKVDWQASNSKIEFEIPTFNRNADGKRVDTINKVLINYQLSEKKDSLFGTLKNIYGVHKFSMLKTENYSEYLNRKFGTDFILPKNDSTELIKIDPVRGMKIFMNMTNNRVIGKTEFSNSLNNLENDIGNFIKKLETYFGSKDMRTNNYYLSVFADKKISDSTITANLPATFKSDFFINNDIPRPPFNSRPIRIYRIYENDEMKFKNRIEGKRIKTIANTVYN
ncbi:hypothetical protein [Tenacibaculum haliotis]|uniref:hypothetical protein n=1 Tax=Tenacibaculum haliotis TaxID=1888914 RepID=UPI0021AFEBE7|nr:hypothetical protein [Tenacibaculum haliotis]MCT4697531.1 hypothetical protein [Tenacibaculum haliotis]